MSSPPSSPDPGKTPPTSPLRPQHAHRSSVQHIPPTPSRLREAQNMSPDDHASHSLLEPSISSQNLTHESSNLAGETTGEPVVEEPDEFDNEEEDNVRGIITEPTMGEENERTRLLENYHNPRVCGLKHCNHGTFSPRAGSIRSNMTGSTADFEGRFIDTIGPVPGDSNHTMFGDSIIDTLGGKNQTTTNWLASKHGIKSQRWMYLTYYFPFLKWITQYRWSWLKGDLIAALTMASFYIPMSLSYAANLGHIPPVNGLYAFVFNPIVYALLGTCPQMVVGPEAAGSLLVGQVVRASISSGSSSDDNGELNAQIAGVVTSIAGAVILIAGLTRLGFLDSVLSRPFLRGFISAIGFVILVDQAIPELGLKAHNISHRSSFDKLVYICTHLHKAQGLTTAVSLGSFTIIMVFRTLKRHLQPRYPSVAYFPDRFIVVVLSAIFARAFEWDKKGLELLGDVKAGDSAGIPFHWPFRTKHMTHIDTALGTSVLIALLGFFESSVAAKSLGEGTSELQGMSLSANRELIALGTANVIGGLFMALPAFGGYGRSKVNASTGGTTPMSSIFLSILSLLCVAFLLPYFQWLPKGVLSAMISVVAYSLIEECPHDIKFFIKIRGWMELSLMAVIFLATILYSLSVGIALGISLSLLAVIRHAAKPRIQILGRVHGDGDKFENAELSPENIEHIEGCLIVKIPEPLTFANTGDLRTRLRRLEQYGTNRAHPSLPRVRNEESNRNIIFDVHGVTSIDGSGTQVLAEIVESYVKRGTRVIFCRLPQRRSRVYARFRQSGIVDICGGPGHFVPSVEAALQLSEVEDIEQYLDRPSRNESLSSSMQRGGRFVEHEDVDLTRLTRELVKTEERYARTYRDVENNHLVRKWNNYHGSQDRHLLDEAGLEGRWYTEFQVGEPPQTLEVDLDMLSPDFYTILTTSSRGSKYDTFASNNHVATGEMVHPLCRMASDVVHFPNSLTSIRLDLPTCNPPKSSRHTLSASGTILGLSPSRSLSQLSSPNLLDQLFTRSIVSRRLWSITLLDATSGILSLGGTIAREVEQVKIRQAVQLENLRNSTATHDAIEREIQNRLAIAVPPDTPLEQHFKWTEVRGTAQGWWQGLLMAGVWVNGIKVLKNQPILLDVNCPVILAPPLAARVFYQAISGAKKMMNTEAQYKRSIYKVPCLNEVNVAFEIGGWNFPVLQGRGTRMDVLYGPAGGLISLGKTGNGTGYCVGIVVETKMGLEGRWTKSGMQETWVLGEPFFRSMGVVFDISHDDLGKGKARVGLRSY